MLLLGVALALSERSTGFSVDEGSYAIQADALSHDSWAIDWPFRPYDPDGQHFPYHAGVVDPGVSSAPTEYAYVSHPAWPSALSVVRGIGGEELGLRLLPMLGVVIAALCGGGLAGRLAGPGAAPWGFWIVATSPVLADGLMLWAHAPSTAAAGVVVLAAVTIAAGRARWWWWVALGVAAGGGVLLRSEGLLVAAAVAGGLGLVGIARHQARLVVAGVATAAAGLGALALEWLWTTSVTSTAANTVSTRAGDEDWIRSRLDGAWTVLLRGAEDPVAALVAVLAVVLVALAVLAARQERPPVRPAVLVGLAAVLVMIRLVVASDDPVSGLLAAWPIAVLGGGAIAPTRERRTLVAVLVGSGAVVLAVVATQYDNGGGLQWGGRYLAPVIVPLGAVAAAGLIRVLPSVLDRRVAGALLIVTAVLGLVVTNEIRQINADALDRVGATGQPAVLVAGDQLARLDWHRWPERCWLSEGDDLEHAIEVLRTARVTRAAYVGFTPEQLEAAGAAGATPDRPGARLGTVEIGPGRITVVRVGEHAFVGCGGRVA